jgi:hypothetical protein
MSRSRLLAAVANNADSKPNATLSLIAQDPEAMMDSPMIRAFFGGKGVTTFHRWCHDPDPAKRFPEADLYLGNVPYWKRRTVLEWRDRQAAMKGVRQQAAKAVSVKGMAARAARSGEA